MSNFLIEKFASFLHLEIMLGNWCSEVLRHMYFYFVLKMSFCNLFLRLACYLELFLKMYWGRRGWHTAWFSLEMSKAVKLFLILGTHQNHLTICLLNPCSKSQRLTASQVDICARQGTKSEKKPTGPFLALVQRRGVQEISNSLRYYVVPRRPSTTCLGE